VWAGVDSVREQKKLEARKMLENAAESHTSGARFVGWRFVMEEPQRLITLPFLNKQPCKFSLHFSFYLPIL
jgi:hypothetical protein